MLSYDLSNTYINNMYVLIILAIKYIANKSQYVHN
jgi:hypothetical protein